MRNYQKKLFFIIYNISAAAFLIVMVEYGCLILNKKSNKDSKPFLFDAKQFNKQTRGIPQEGGTTKMSYVDPHLGYAHEHEVDKHLSQQGSIPGFVIFGDPTSEDAIRIIALGGSTTDPLDRYNWPAALEKIFSAHRIPAIVYNGGVSGYSTNQELLKLIRDGLPMKPDIVVSLNGINDLGFIHSLKKHPMVHPYQKRAMKKIAGNTATPFLPNTIDAFRRWRKRSVPKLNRVVGINYGPEVNTTPADQWENNIKIMHAVASEFGIKYHCFLQPVLGIGEHNTSDGEKNVIDADDSRKGQYIAEMREFYNEALKVSKQLLFVTDLTEVFSGMTDVYRDPRHPNQKGYKLIAEAIFQTLQGRGLFHGYSPSITKHNLNKLKHANDFSHFFWKKEGKIQIASDVALAPDGTRSADLLCFENKSILFQANTTPVNPGDKVKGAIWLWGPKPGKIFFGVAKHCSAKQYEGSTRAIMLTTKSTRHEVTHIFRAKHNCSRIQLTSPPEGIKEVYAWGARSNRQ